MVAQETAKDSQTPHQTDGLLQVALALSDALTFDEVADAIINEGFSRIGASGGALALFSEDGQRLEIIKPFEHPKDVIQHWQRFPSREPANMLVFALQTHQPIWLGSLQERLNVLPSDSDVPIDTGYQAWAGLPLMIHSRPVGRLGVTFEHPQAFDLPMRNFMMTLAHLCAQALERARLHRKAQDIAVLEEKQRLAHELQDSVAQVLFSASLVADSLPALLQRNPEKAHERIRQLMTYNRAALAETRSLLLALRPESIAYTPLPTLLDQLLQVVLGRKNMETQFVQEGELPQLNTAVHVALYRIAQESITNVVRHSQANQLEIILSTHDSIVCLQVRDNGCGFDLEQTQGTGLRRMREQERAIGGQLSIISTLEGGTTVSIEWHHAPDAAAT